MPVNCARCGELTEEYAPVYLGVNAFGRETWGLLCHKCRKEPATRPPEAG